MQLLRLQNQAIKAGKTGLAAALRGEKDFPALFNSWRIT